MVDLLKQEFCLYNIAMVLLKKCWGFLAVFILSVFSILPLFNSGFFPMHDDTQVARVFEMGKALKDGIFPVRWVADLGYGYGYPIFNFYSPLPYYIGGLFTLIGFDVLIATKIMIGLGIVLSGIFMYLLAREFWGAWGGIVSALFYVYAPYHALDIYVRGAVGEIYAYSFLPLTALGFYKVIKYSVDNSKLKVKIQNEVLLWLIIGSVGFAGVILSHNLTAMMVAPLIIIVLLFHCFIVQRDKGILSTYYLILTAVLGLLLSAFYWFPALMEMKYTNVLSQIGGGADFKDHFVCIEQLWNSQWGFGGSTSGCIDGMSFMIGKIYIAIVFLSLLFSMKRKIISFAFLGFLISIFFTLEVSRPVWEAVPQMAFFQYPWRFLLLSSFFASFLAGSLIWGTKFFFKKMHYKVILAFLFIVLLFFFNLKFFQPQTISPRSSFYYTNESMLKWTTSKISDEYLPKDFEKPKNPSEIVKNKIISLDSSVNIKTISEKPQRLTAEVDTIKDSSILIKTAFFPAWHVFVDGKEISFRARNDGLEIPIKSGNHVLELIFIQTPLEKITNILSLTGVILLVLGIIYRRKNEKT